MMIPKRYCRSIQSAKPLLGGDPLRSVWWLADQVGGLNTCHFGIGGHHALTWHMIAVADFIIAAGGDGAR